MKCNQNKEKASLYLSDLLEKAERADYERHLEHCAECRAEVERYRRMIGLVKELPRAHAPEGLRSAVMQRTISTETALKGGGLSHVVKLPVFRAVAAVLVLAVGVGLAFYAYHSTQYMGPQIAEDKPKPPAGAPAADHVSGSHDALARTEGGPPGGTYEALGGKEGNGGAPPAGQVYACAEMPGNVDPMVIRSNLYKVNRALEQMNIDDLSRLATEDHGTLWTLVESHSTAAFNDSIAASPGDRNVFYQLTQKRLLVTALNKADNLDQVSRMAEALSEPLDGEQGRQSSAGKCDTVLKLVPEEEVDVPSGGAGTSERRSPATEQDRDLKKQFKFHRKGVQGDGEQEVTVIFRQGLILEPKAAPGRKAVLDKERKSDLKLVFNNLSTLENYSVGDFAKSGFTVRLSEEEFLLLLKYIKDIGGIEAKLGPMHASLITEEVGRGEGKEAEEALKDAESETLDPFAVELNIKILDE